MSAAHTPGPWRLEQTACLSVVADGHLGALAEVRSRLDYGGMNSAVAATREANARLIAAAPEMLEILREVDEKNDGALQAMGADGVTPPAWFVEQCKKIKAVITKSTGSA